MTDYAAPVYISKRNPVSFGQTIFQGCLIVSVLSVAYLLISTLSGSLSLPFAKTPEASDLTLSLIQCLLGAVALFIPKVMMKHTGIKLPDAMCSFFYIFILCATVLGEVFSLYYAIPCWDSLLHFSSGIMAGMLGGILIVNFFKKKDCGNLISPLFIAVAVVCFALCIGVVWEIYEFAADSLLGLNMQKFTVQDGTALIGQAALADTMKDLIVDFAGAIVAAVSTFICLKHKKGWLSAYTESKAVPFTRKFQVSEEVFPFSA